MKEFKKVILDGQEVNFEDCAFYMDDEIREELHREWIAGEINSDQEFLDRYCEDHYKKYGVEFDF